MTGLETFRKVLKVSQYIERNLENLARIVEGTDSRTLVWTNLTGDLKGLFPQEDADSLAQALVTEQCRVAYLKLTEAAKVKNYISGHAGGHAGGRD
jgi:hypothetical protein